MGTGSRSWLTKKPAIAAAVGVALCGAGVGIWLATGSSGASPLVSSTTSVQTVTTGTITRTVSSSGTVEPANQANLDFAVSGRVTAVDVSPGQTVAIGQTLATVDDSTLSAALAQAQASLANDQALLSADQDNGASTAQITSDSAAVASAQIQVTSAQTSLADATLASPIAGTVASVALAVGQQVTASGTTSGAASSTGSGAGSGSSQSSVAASPSGGSSSGGSSSGGSSSGGSSSASSASSAQVVVVSTGAYLVNCTVDSSQVSQVKDGNQANITPAGGTGPVYGTVGSVGLLASTTSGVASFPVVIDVTGSPAGLYGGSSATVSIITEELYDVVVVPTPAIHYSGNGTTVLLDAGGSQVTRGVTIGASSGGETQVTSGLAVGDKVFVTEVSFRGNPAAGSGRSGFLGRSGAGGFPGGSGFGGGGFGG